MSLYDLVAHPKRVALVGGVVPLEQGGTEADLSATGAGYLKQATTGAAVTVSAIAAADLPTGIDATKIGAGGVTSTEFGYLANVTSDVQTQLDAKASTAYVDAAVNGLDWKASCRAATTANITLSGAQTIDGVSIIAGDRVLVKNQSSGAENGIYVCASGAWARAGDANVSAEVTGGMACYITEGSTQADTGWVLTTNDAITLGSTSLTYSQFGGSGGAVTSVGASSPLSSSGGSTPTISFSNQTANTVLAGATSGGAAAPTFRALVAADIPSLDAAKITSGTVATARLGSGTANSSSYLRGDQTWQTIVASDPTLYTESDGGTITFNLANSKSQIVVLGGNRTLAVSGDAGNDVFDIMLKQDGTGGRTVTWFSGITWAGGGTPPTLTTGANKTDWFGFRRTGSGTYTGVVVGANI